MKFYFVLHYIGGRGGVETVVTEVTKELIHRGHDVSILLPKESEDSSWEEDLPSVYYYNCSEKSNIIDDIIGLSKKLNELEKPDVIIGTHTPLPTLYSRLALGPSSNIKLISWLHNPTYSFRSSPHYVKYADYHWAISKEIEKNLVERLNITDNISWIGNPIELNEKQVKVTLGNRFVYIGRLENKQKRVDLLLKMLAKLDYDWSLDIVGDGVGRQELLNLTRELKIQDKVQFHGWCKNPWSVVKQATALVLLSAFEGFGMVVIEALLRGLPVISTKSGGPDELIQHKENGWLIEVDDMEKLLQVFREVNGLDIGTLIDMSNKAKESVKRFSVEKVVDRMFQTISDRER